MIRLFVTLVLLLPTAQAIAQQPDVRLELMSLYQMRSVTLHPLDHAQMRSCAKCDWVPWNISLHIAADGDLVISNAAAKSAQRLSFRGGARVESDVAPSRTILTPLELSSKHGRIVFLTTLPLEDYVAEVVQGETSGNLPAEALRAMAVAARSYATHFRERHKAERFDFCDTTHCQFVQSNITSAVMSAIEATRGEILWTNGAALAAYYHKDCGGRTESASDVWTGAKDMRSEPVIDPFCVRVSQPWRSELSRTRIDAGLRLAGLKLPRDWDHIKVAQRTASGRARTLLFGTGNAENGVPVTASSFRFAMGRAYGWNSLKSDWYDVSVTGDRVVFSGRGTGHGVGLCQVGASEMARSGKSYREILAFYYPGATVSVAADGIAWRKSSSAGIDVYAADKQPTPDMIDLASRAFAWAESQTRMQSPKRPGVYIYSSVEMFRDATGEPGWIAASTRNNKIRTQPFTVLGARTRDVLRHEFVHFLLETNASSQTPLWFREGLAMLITGEQRIVQRELSPSQMESILQSRSDYKATQAAYGSALAIVARLEQQHGRAKLLNWLARGLPSDVLADAVAQKASHQP